MTSFVFTVATVRRQRYFSRFGSVVFFGMLGVTIFGLVFTPAFSFYTFIRKLGSKIGPKSIAFACKGLRKAGIL